MGNNDDQNIPKERNWADLTLESLIAVWLSVTAAALLVGAAVKT